MAMNDPLLGTQVANFRLDRLLGRGGMASVYLAWDVNLHRPVAVKILSDQYREDPAYTNRFLREARAMAAWQHPNIAQVHTAGIDNGLPYFVLEYIPGHDLAYVIRSFREQSLLLSYAEVLRIARSTADALDYAHERGVIHRDVKPSNLIIADDGRVVLTDFGLAMRVAEGTMGEVFGSPQYISPEQASNSARAVPQSDIYSFGVMLFEMLTGSLPFYDEYPAALAMQHIQDPPPTPRSLNPDLPPGVDAVLLRALDKNPTHRYPTARALVDDLDAALQGKEFPSAAATRPVPPHVEQTLPALAETGPLPAPVTPRPQRPIGPPPRVPSATGPAAPPVRRNPPPPPPPAARPRLFPRGLGCALIALLLLGGTVALAANLIRNIDLPTIPAPNDGPPTETPTLATVAIVIPVTETAAPLPTQTFPPTNTPTLEPTATETLPPTDTPAPLPTATPEAPSPTPQPYEIHFVKFEDQGIFLVNRSGAFFPLDFIRLVNGEEEFLGTRWDLPDGLDDNRCVALWRDRHRTRAPGELDCRLDAQEYDTLINPAFWDQEFEVWFGDEKLGNCFPAQEECIFRFILLPNP